MAPQLILKSWGAIFLFKQEKAKSVLNRLRFIFFYSPLTRFTSASIKLVI